GHRNYNTDEERQGLNTQQYSSSVDGKGGNKASTSQSVNRTRGGRPDTQRASPRWDETSAYFGRYGYPALDPAPGHCGQSSGAYLDELMGFGGNSIGPYEHVGGRNDAEWFEGGCGFVVDEADEYWDGLTFEDAM
ncbi:unnamed protein product, partial [Amoebophrya sp. A25]